MYNRGGWQVSSEGRSLSEDRVEMGEWWTAIIHAVYSHGSHVAQNTTIQLKMKQRK